MSRVNDGVVFIDWLPTYRKYEFFYPESDSNGEDNKKKARKSSKEKELKFHVLLTSYEVCIHCSPIMPVNHPPYTVHTQLTHLHPCLFFYDVPTDGADGQLFLKAAELAGARRG